MNQYIEPKQEIRVAVDAVCIAKEQDQSYILLIQREYEPFKGSWALPGGFLLTDEELDIGALRELSEETSMDINGLIAEEIGVFGKIGRDPRRRIISVAFLIKMDKRREIKIANESLDVKWINLAELDFEALAFDHSDVINKALKLLN